MRTPSRRQVLSGLSGAVLLAVGAGSVRRAAALATVELDQSTQIDTESALPPVALDWRETVNGEVREDTDLTAASDGNTGDVGVIVDEAVLPGDTGAVTLRAAIPDEADLNGGERDSQSAELLLRYSLTETAENGLTEPERKAGDDTPDRGELQDVATVDIWRDMGLGTGNGAVESVPLVSGGDEMIASGTLAAVGESPAFEDGYRLTRNGETCLSPGDAVYVSFRWSIPTDVGNVIQGDSVQFAIGVEPRRCDGR
ncbi:hypothetical protein [Halobellus sp. GM3]|uniref:hypothetical protein n=1 Tax=Halobellus sp. GM3 TaxID=3458410 RepID=UPI00403D61A8